MFAKGGMGPSKGAGSMGFQNMNQQHEHQHAGNGGGGADSSWNSGSRNRWYPPLPDDHRLVGQKSVAMIGQGDWEQYDLSTNGEGGTYVGRPQGDQAEAPQDPRAFHNPTKDVFAGGVLMWL